MSMKNSNDTIGNRTRDLPVCSAVPQPTAPPRAPYTYLTCLHILSWTSGVQSGSSYIMFAICFTLRYSNLDECSPEYYVKNKPVLPPKPACSSWSLKELHVIHHLCTLIIYDHIHFQVRHYVITYSPLTSKPYLKSKSTGYVRCLLPSPPVQAPWQPACCMTYRRRGIKERTPSRISDKQIWSQEKRTKLTNSSDNTDFHFKHSHHPGVDENHIRSWILFMTI